MSPEELLMAQAEMRRRQREGKKWRPLAHRGPATAVPQTPAPDFSKFPTKTENGVTVYICPPAYDKALEYGSYRFRGGALGQREYVDDHDEAEEKFYPSKSEYRALCKAANGGSYAVLDDDDPDSRQVGHNLARQLIEVIRRCFRKNKPLTFGWQELLGCDLDYFRDHIEKQFTPGMNWGNWGEWHIDHIRPLASFSLDFRPELLMACNYRNLQPLWGVDNCSKGSRNVQ